jgi:hypothetical protein
MRLERLVATASRFLSERTFTLVVAPAVADVQFDGDVDVAGYLSVLRAIAGGAYEDLTADTSALTFLGLALLPVGYYSFFFLLCAQNLGPIDAWRDVAAIMGVVLVLSMGPVVACYWPEPQRRDERLELP